MNILNVLSKSYGRLHNYPNIPYWFLTPFRKVVRIISNLVLPNYLNQLNEKRSKSCAGTIIVSLTSFPARIDCVWQVIVCMLNQSESPKLILLWLSKEQFPTEDCIPEKLRNLQNDIFQIRMVDGDIRSHKKYYYVAKEFPNELIFLIDDDIYYPSDLLERSYKAYLNHPDCIVCNYGYKITYNDIGRHKSYSKWQPVYKGLIGNNVFFGSGGGTLLKPSQLYKDLTDIDRAIDLVPLADDIWLNTMTKLAQREVCLLPSGLILPIKNDSETLNSVNNGLSQNDVQIDNIERKYGRCFDRTYRIVSNEDYIF